MTPQRHIALAITRVHTKSDYLSLLRQLGYIARASDLSEGCFSISNSDNKEVACMEIFGDDEFVGYVADNSLAYALWSTDVLSDESSWADITAENNLQNINNNCRNTFVCHQCDSESIYSESVSSWDISEQAWLIDGHNNYYCNDCGSSSVEPVLKVIE